MRLATAGAYGLRLDIEPLRAEPLLGDSAEVATLARVCIAVDDTVLTRGRDGEGAFEDIELPLIDLADWLARGWARLLFEGPPVDRPNRRDRPIRSCAQFWLDNRRPIGPLERQQRVYDWASHHAVEFAATDYVLPNLVFQRIDDAIELSWAASSDDAPGSDLRFDFNAGRRLVGWADLRDLWLALLGWVAARCDHVDADPRVQRVRAVLALDHDALGSAAIALWAHGRAQAASLVDADEVRRVGERGVGGPISAFLRSSEGVLSAELFAEVVGRFQTHATAFDRVTVDRLVDGLDRTIDLRAPWESGYRLARQVRGALLARTGSTDPLAPLDIAAVFAALDIAVLEGEWPEQAFEGVCLVEDGARALAIVNRSGRLASTRGGARATLAHELCHVLFDADPARPIGQVERSGRTTSPVEKRANAFAAELLLPQAVFARLAARGRVERENVQAVARRYGVGIELAEWQAGDGRVRAARR